MAENEPLLDLVFATKQLGGNEELLKKMFGKFAEQYADSVQTVRDHVDEKNYDGAKRIIHGIKGVSGNLGLRALQHACRDAEHILLKPDDPTLDSHLAQCIDDFERLLYATLNEIQTYEPGEPEEAEAPIAEDNVQAVDEAKSTLLKAIENFQFISPPELKELLGKLQSTSIDVASLEKAINDLDYTLAKNLLNES